MRFVSNLLLTFTASAALLAQQNPLPGPAFSEKDVQVVRRGEKPPTSLGAKVAVVVGIDRYQYLNKLEYSDKDAKDVTVALQSIGFVVRGLSMDGEIPPANSTSILTEIQRICAAADPQDTIAVFLSGHGFSQAGSKEGFFCAHYTDPENLAATAVSLDEVRRLLLSSKARQRMMIVDACRNVPGARTVGARLEIAEAFRAEGLGVMFSTSPGTQSWEPQGIEKDAQGRTIENGIFTHYFLRGLEGDADRNRDGWVTFHELAYHTWTEVKVRTELKQKPHLEWVGEPGSDFLLREVSARAGSAVPASAGSPAPAVRRAPASPTPAAPKPEAPAPAQPEATPPDATLHDVSAWADVLVAVPDPKVVASTKVRERMVATGYPWKVRDKATGLVMLLVPPGQFLMGSPAGEPGRIDCEQQHQRLITKPFYMSETEVTQAAWGMVMPNNPSQFQGNANPVEMVSWNDIQPFLQKTGLSLPSEAQWEYACRAGTTSAFSFGGALTNEQANHGKNTKRTSPVGTRKKNAWGFADMHGNVLEWCADGYQRDYPGDDANEAPVSGTEKVMRGGGWGLASPRCRSAYRGNDAPNARHNVVGFRVVKML